MVCEDSWDDAPIPSLRPVAVSMASSLQSSFIREDSHHPGPPRPVPGGSCSHLLALLLFILIIRIADASVLQPVIEHQPFLWELHGQLCQPGGKSGCEAQYFVWPLVPKHPAFSARIPLTFSIVILTLSQLLKLTRLELSPVAPTLQIREKTNQGSISSGMRLSFSGGIFLRPWGQRGQHQAKQEQY